VREQAVAAGDVHHPAAAAPPADAPSHLPRFIQFLARQSSNAAHDAADAVEQRVARESRKIVWRESAAGAG